MPGKVMPDPTLQRLTEIMQEMQVLSRLSGLADEAKVLLYAYKFEEGTRSADLYFSFSLVEHDLDSAIKNLDWGKGHLKMLKGEKTY